MLNYNTGCGLRRVELRLHERRDLREPALSRERQRVAAQAPAEGGVGAVGIVFFRSIRSTKVGGMNLG